MTKFLKANTDQKSRKRHKPPSYFYVQLSQAERRFWRAERRPLFAAASANDFSSFSIGGDLTVTRLGFGAMRLTGKGIWGWPPDSDNARKVLRQAVELGANLIDTADAYGPD